jgi:hypothetical protein
MENGNVLNATIDRIDHFIGTSDWTLYVLIGSLLTN